MTNLIVTLVALVGIATLGVYAHWKMGQPWDDLKPKRVPWGLVMIMSVFGVVVLLVSLANMAGIQTGMDQGPFARF